MLTFMLGWLATVTQNDWIFYATMLSAFILVAGTIYSTLKWTTRKLRLHELFEVYYEPSDNKIVHSLVIAPSTHAQSIRITIKMKADVHLGFINLDMKGKGQLPSLDRISDWNLGSENADIRYWHREDGSWNLTIIRGGYRYSGQRIRADISCKAPAVFDGHLEVFLSCEEGARRRVLLPFKVEDSNAKI